MNTGNSPTSQLKCHVYNEIHKAAHKKYCSVWGFAFGRSRELMLLLFFPGERDNELKGDHLETEDIARKQVLKVQL